MNRYDPWDTDHRWDDGPEPPPIATCPDCGYEAGYSDLPLGPCPDCGEQEVIEAQHEEDYGDRR